MRGPSTGAFQTAVCTVLPCHVTSRGRPTLTESKRAITSFPNDDHRKIAPLRDTFRLSAGDAHQAESESIGRWCHLTLWIGQSDG